ncbi:ABC-type transport auxiliary lipoprotein family protein, partial [Pseudomonas syringae]
YALIDVVWTLGLREAGATAGSKRQSLTCSSVIREQAGEGMENLIMAHQKAVAQLADKIAATAASWTAQRASRCL